MYSVPASVVRGSLPNGDGKSTELVRRRTVRIGNKPCRVNERNQFSLSPASDDQSMSRTVRSIEYICTEYEPRP